MPASVLCHGRRYEHVETFKHDFFAATGMYRGPEGLVVLKLGRTNDFLTLPMRWLGALLTCREVRMYAQLRDVASEAFAELSEVEPPETWEVDAARELAREKYATAAWCNRR